MGDIDPNVLVLNERIEELEAERDTLAAKLKRANLKLQVMDEVVVARSELFSSDHDLLDNLRDRIRTTLAELNYDERSEKKGQDDE